MEKLHAKIRNAMVFPKFNRKYVSIFSALCIIVVLASVPLILPRVKGGTWLPLLAQRQEVPDDTDTTSKVATHIVLPDETPTIATVTDKEKLSSQPFFLQAENEDKLLIYTQAKKAILYRPSTDKIIDVAPLITEETSAPDSALSETNEVTVTLLNGSEKVGVTNSLDDDLVKTFPNIKISQKAAAARSDYSQTLVVDVSGKNFDFATQLSRELGGIVGSLPDGEQPATTDLVVIVGNN